MIKKLLVIFSLVFAFSFGSVLADFSNAFAKNENKTEQTNNRKKKKKSSKKKNKKSSGKKKSTGKKKISSKKKKTGKKKYTSKKKKTGKKKYTSKKKKGKKYASKKKKSSKRYTSRSYTPRYTNTTSGPSTYTPPKTYGSDDNSSNIGREYSRTSDESTFKKEPKAEE